MKNKIKAKVKVKVKIKVTHNSIGNISQVR